MLSARERAATPRDGLPPSGPASARGSRSFTPRPGSALKHAGADLTKSMRKGVDTVPHLIASGKRGEVDPWCCVPDLIVPTPRTPQNARPISQRHKRRTEPGEITVHWGLKNSPPPDPGDGYGIRSARGENVEQNFKSGQVLGIADYMKSRGESIYYSTIREPLGATYSRGFILPDETNKSDFRGFGKELIRDDFDAKETIFPRNVEPDSFEDKQRYIRTHGAYDAGETACRGYSWPRKIVDDDHFRFGIVDEEGRKQAGKGVKSAMSGNDIDDGRVTKTRVVKSTSEKYRQVANDQLGRSRNMCQGEPPVPPDHAFGLAGPADQIGAAELMRGFYSVAEQRPDTDLGRCTLPGRRNFKTRRPFGIPSIRSDVVAPPPERRSVANATNYGDDHDASALIFPSKFACRGVTEKDLMVRRSKQDLRGLLVGAGFELADEDFDEVWDVAVQVFGDDQPFVSLEVYTEFLTDRITSGVPMHRSQGGASTYRGTEESAEVEAGSAIERNAVQNTEPESDEVAAA